MKIITISIAAVIVGVSGLAAMYWWTRPPEKIATGFECPELHAKSSAMALQETPSTVGNISDMLNGGEQENAIRLIVQRLKKKHPDAKNDEIVNYLATAYCPIVARDSGLSNGEKTSRMDQFSSQVYRIVRKISVGGE
jgi:hypothetical protein